PPLLIRAPPTSSVFFQCHLALRSLPSFPTRRSSDLILIYARVGRQAARSGKSLPASAYFAAGYLMAWTGFALAATAVQWDSRRRSEEHTSELQSLTKIVCRLLLVKKKKKQKQYQTAS